MLQPATISYFCALDAQGNNRPAFDDENSLGNDKKVFETELRRHTDMTFPKIWALIDAMETNTEYPITLVDSMDYYWKLDEMGFKVKYVK